MIKWVFKFTITEFHLIFVLILGIHASFLTVRSRHAEQMAEIKIQEEQRLNDKKKKYGVKTEEELLAAMAAEKFVRVPFVITYLGNVRQKRHSELLSLLDSKMKTTAVVHTGVGPLVGIVKGKEVSLSSTKDVEFKISDAQKKNLVKRLIKQKLGGVDVCKKKHLLEDEFLMGTIKVNMKINGSDNLAIPKFQGHGNQKVIQSLETCVKGQLASMSFPRELNDEEVSFDLRVN